MFPRKLPHNAGFRRLSEELEDLRCVGVFTGSRPRRTQLGEVLLYGEFLRRLWSGALVD